MPLVMLPVRPIVFCQIMIGKHRYLLRNIDQFNRFENILSMNEDGYL